jgi:hypothetical protein
MGKFRAKLAPRSGDLAEQIRRREIALARLRRQEWERRSSEWILKPQAEAAWRELADFIRRGIADTVPTLTARVAPCCTMGAMAGAIREVVYEALRSLAETDVGFLASESKPLPDVPDSATKLEAETGKVGALALLRQLEVDAANGAVISVAGFAQTFGEACSRVRQRMLSMEAHLPPRLWGAKPAGHAAIIQAAISEALVEMPTFPAQPGSEYFNQEATDATTDDQRRRRDTRGPGASAGAPASGSRGETKRKRVDNDRG